MIKQLEELAHCILVEPSARLIKMTSGKWQLQLGYSFPKITYIPWVACSIFVTATMCMVSSAFFCTFLFWIPLDNQFFHQNTHSLSYVIFLSLLKEG